MSDASRSFEKACERLDEEAWSEAIRLFRIARDEFFTQGNLENVAVCDMNIGATLESLGDYSGALSSLDEAAAFFRRNSDLEKLADCKVNRGVVLEALERPAEALAEYDTAYEVYRSMDIIQNAAVCKINTGIILESIRDYRKAFSAFSIAQQLFEEINDEQGESDARRALQRLEVYDL